MGQNAVAVATSNDAEKNAIDTSKFWLGMCGAY